MRVTEFVTLASLLVAKTSTAFVLSNSNNNIRLQRDARLLSSSSSSSESASTSTEVPIIVNGQNIELTPALVDHVNKRIGGTLNKLSSNGAVKECDVILSVSKNPKVRTRQRNLCVVLCRHWNRNDR